MKFSPLSQKILLLLVFLSGLGLVQVYSASYIFATETYESSLFFVKKQFIFMIIGFLGLFTICYLSWPVSRLIGICLWFFSVLALVFTLIPEFSVSVGGSSRWIDTPIGLRVQPSEWFKITSPFAFIYFMALKEKWPLHSHFYYLTIGFSILVPVLILINQPDFGSVVLFLCWMFSVFFIMGLKWRYTLGSLFLGFIVLGVLIAMRDYRISRMQAFLNPWEDPLGKGFQIIQSLLSFHSGGFFGQGLGQGQSKLFFLPEAHTDFTLAVFGEEMGFIGFLLLFLAYFALGFFGIKVCFRTKDLSKKITAFSMVFLFLISTIVHFGVNLGLLPPTGLVLPFLSYGGNGLVCALLSFGWVIQIENSNAK